MDLDDKINKIIKDINRKLKIYDYTCENNEVLQVDIENMDGELVLQTEPFWSKFIIKCDREDVYLVNTDENITTKLADNNGVFYDVFELFMCQIFKDLLDERNYLLERDDDCF